jgi:formylglycine-generating enzyme required for sulfatase activity
MKSLVVTILATLVVALPASAQSCAGDIAQDGRVDGGDLGLVLSNWGPVVPTSPISVRCDIDGDGAVTGGDLGLLLSGWGYCPASIVSFDPAQACLLGGTEITVTGTWLGQASSVTVGGIPCAGLTLVSATELRATVPAGVAGPATVEVTTPAGTSAAATAFTYLDPQVTGIAPSSGVPQGGALVTITGQCLGGTTSVSFGGVPGTGLSAPSDSQVQVTSPPGSPGAVDVTVAGPKGTITVPGGFTYQSIVVPAWATLVEAQPDPAVVTDPALRAAITATGLAWRVRHAATQIEMLLVPPGKFLMGCIMGSEQSGCLADELPVHQVALTRAFYLGRFEITQAQWQSAMGFNPSLYKNASAQVPSAQVPERPVDTVSWNNTQSFLAAFDLRLPTEAEWEFACRAGTLTPFHNGSSQVNSLGAIAWFLSNSFNQTRPVGRRAANALGLHDMIGNVAEWVADRYGAYSANSQVDPTGSGGGVERVLRGGSFNAGEQSSRSSTRWSWDVSQPAVVIAGGFRIARNP